MAVKSKKSKINTALQILSAILSSGLLIVLISAIYFLVLISSKPKSFPFLTHKIEERINQNLHSSLNVKIGESSIEFSQFYKIIIKFDDVKLINDEKKDLILPQIEAEFSIFNLILFKIFPSEIRIISPKIVIDNSSGKAQIALEDGKEEIDAQELLLQKEYFHNLLSIFISLNESQVAIKHFTIIDGKIKLKNKNRSKIITIKEATISTFFADGYLNLKTENTISFNPEEADLTAEANCKFKKNDGLKCNINFKDFIPLTISSFDKKLSALTQITGSFDGTVNFVATAEKKLETVDFNITSKSSSFHYPAFFSDKINLQDFSASGKLDNNLKTFSLDNLDCKFDDVKFAMSLSTNNFLDSKLQKTLMQFRVGDVPTNSLKLLWPTFLNQNNIRDWFLSHIQDGVIQDGYATMIMGRKNGSNHLQKIESELAFSGLSLEYDKEFPTLSKVGGIAYFNQKQMQIDISRGDVLKSKINFATVAIPNFHSSKVMLEIKGNIYGAAEDSLKHISYKSQFAKGVSKYFNGNSHTNLEIKLPIDPNLRLKDVYIKVASNIENLTNYSIKNADVTVLTTKEFGNNDFAIEIDLTKSEIHTPRLNLNKKIGEISKIKTILSFDNSNLYLKRFTWNQEKEVITGDLSLQMEPLKITELNLQNRGFADSEFAASYKISNDYRSLKLNGERVNLRSILRPDRDESLINFKHNNIKISLDEVYLANDQKLSDVDIDFNCDGSKCEKGHIVAKLNSTKNIDIKIFAPKNNKPSTAKGRVEDVSILAKAFGISNKMVDGDAEIEAKFTDNGLDGTININSGFTILKNEVVEKIYKNNVFAKLKNKILNSNETQFDNLKLKFALNGGVININTLIANSYTMGFTAKGEINLDNNDIFLKGLIIPGYALNKLFGIGRIPILGSIIVGEEGGGIFAVRYDYIKKDDNEGKFSINPASAIIPGGIRNVFDLF